VPARVVRPLSDGERAAIPEIVERYVRLKEKYQAALADPGAATAALPTGARR
jgi:hypothetical protein